MTFFIFSSCNLTIRYHDLTDYATGKALSKGNLSDRKVSDEGLRSKR